MDRTPNLVTAGIYKYICLFSYDCCTKKSLRMTSPVQDWNPPEPARRRRGDASSAAAFRRSSWDERTGRPPRRGLERRRWVDPNGWARKDMKPRMDTT